MPVSKHSRRFPGKTPFELDQDILERLESLEHWSNQHDILLSGLMKHISNLELSHIIRRTEDDS